MTDLSPEKAKALTNWPVCRNGNRRLPQIAFTSIKTRLPPSSRRYCTVRTAEPLTPPELAPMVLVPAALQLARPATLGALAMVATGAEVELQWLFSVMSCVLASLNVPVATNACVLPAFAVTVAGVTASDTSVPVPTVNVVLPVTPDEEAEIVTVPPFFP